MDPNASGSESSSTFRHSFEATSSGIDLSGTGLSVAPSDTNDLAYAHRRLSWSGPHGGPQDPALARLAPVEEDPKSVVDHPLREGSTLNLDASSYAPLLDADRDAASEAPLTGGGEPTADERWSRDAVDPERSAGFVSRSGREYPPAQKFSFANVFRRASKRIANLEEHVPYAQLQVGDSPMLHGIRDAAQPNVEERVAHRTRRSGPLRGRALGVLGPTNPLRLRLYKLLIHPLAEPTILALILPNAVALVVQASRTLLLPSAESEEETPITVKGYFHAWEDFVIFVLFVLFTFEALARICLSGLFLDPEVSLVSLFSSFSKSARLGRTKSASTDDAGAPWMRSGSLSRGFTLRRVYERVAEPLSIPLSSHARADMPPFAQASAVIPLLSPASNDRRHADDSESRHTFLSRVMRSEVLDSDHTAFVSLPFRLDVEFARSKVVRNIPYLRQGWGRIDFLAVIGFWVSFGLATAGLERGTHHIGIFRALSVLRTARLIGITNGTTTIMRSLKIARPLLANVLFFIVFAVALFSIIGVQLFKRSLRRSCHLIPVLGEEELMRLKQMCGGHINATTLMASPYIRHDGTFGNAPKGYICPLGQLCIEGGNPFSGVQSFDTVYYAILQVIVLASGSTWAGAMYRVIASEYFAASIFFILGILVLHFWLFNLLVAVITHSFSAIRSGTKHSAFGAAPLGSVDEKSKEGWCTDTGRHIGQNRLKTWWSYTRWFWVLLAFATLVAEATATADMSAAHKEAIDLTESILTLAFDIEIIARVAVELPEWRNFFLHGSNLMDLFIAIASSIIQIPFIRNSRVYPWLTVFQLARFYRVLLVVPRMKPLMLTVFGNMYGLVNMTLFLVLITFLAALFAVQLIQGDMKEESPLNFGQLFNSFLGVYQILSIEDWTGLLYEMTEAELKLGQAIVICIFVCCWLLFSNFIVLQMFIAVINENFDMAEEAKRKMQASNHSRQQSKSVSRWTHLNPYRWFKAKSTTVATQSRSSTLVPEEADVLVRYDSLDHQPAQKRFSTGGQSRHLRQSSLGKLHEIFAGSNKMEEIPLLELRKARSEARAAEERAEHDIDRYLDILAQLKHQPTASKQSEDIPRVRTIELIQKHRTYDKTFWIFPQTNTLRRLCQRVVWPSGGERIFGTPPSPAAHTLFHLVIFLAVLGNVVIESVASPIYRHHYYMQHGPVRSAWFHITEVTFGLVLVAEFVIKVVADGFAFTPNAYIRSIWNILDFVIMAGVLVHVSFTLIFVAGLSRFVRALKALQALRFMTLIDKMRGTFEDLILAGFIRILDAAVLAMLYLIPFSVWGTTIFAGLMNECNDKGVKGLGDCTNEYVNTLHEGQFGYLVPRVWENPSKTFTFSFDSFPASLLILFEIVSQVGWVDVMTSAMSITGKDLQPRINASQANAIFFVIYNLLGGAVILTLFVSIIIGNFAERTGSAYLTDAQREWIDLQKLLRRLKPSKRPKFMPTSPFRVWCYERAIHKHGWWARMMTLLFVAEMLVLMTQAFSAENANDWHNFVSLFVSAVYVVDTFIRLYGLGWHAFRANGWNLFDVLVASGSFLTTLFARFYPTDVSTQFLEKLFLVSMAFKLVERVAILNQLFKTGTASLPQILSLLGLWLTLIIFFAIMNTEVFGLTKWYSAETPYQNFQTIGSALLLLMVTSTGEGWTQFMHDYALGHPHCTDVSGGVYKTDCGSTAWSYTLFIAWNLLSMFIFVNVFTAVVVDSFSYVFQSTGGVMRSITRHETRAFKKAWAEFSNPETRLLEHPNLHRFLAKLDGVFDVRIYPSHYSPASILATCRNKTTGQVSVRKLNRLLNTIDFETIRKRRAEYVRICQEANVLYRRGKGISFTEMLILLAHHKLIDEKEALGLKELEAREEMLELLADLVALEKVRSQLRMVVHRRRFLREREEGRVEGQGVSMRIDDGGAVESEMPPPTLVDTALGTSASPEPVFPRSEYGEEWRREQSPAMSSRALSPAPECVARERMGTQDNLLENPSMGHSVTAR